MRYAIITATVLSSALLSAGAGFAREVRTIQNEISPSVSPSIQVKPQHDINRQLEAPFQIDRRQPLPPPLGGTNQVPWCRFVPWCSEDPTSMGGNRINPDPNLSLPPQQPVNPQPRN